MSFLQPGETCWRVETARRAAFVVDYQAYYLALLEALPRAERQILLVGWSFDPRTRLMPDGEARNDAPDAIGRLLIQLAHDRPELDIHVLIWRSALAISATQGFFPHRAEGWFKGTRVRFLLDNSVPFGACHHQKLVVIDDAFAFSGSGDLCLDRGDTPAHSDEDARRRGPGKGCHAPRHEVMVAVEGPVATALGELARQRWAHAGERPPAPPAPPQAAAWPPSLSASLSDVPIGIARTQPAWRAAPAVREVQALSLAAVARAKRTIYIENQYFTAPSLAEAISARLAEPDGPEVVLVSTAHSASWFDRLTMDRTRQILLWRLRAADIFGRFRAYAPLTTGGAAIIVHAKVMVIDDALARIGSANLNNRSAGFDTECDLAAEAATAEQRAAITDFRDGLVGHWLARTAEDVRTELARQSGGLIAAIEGMNRHGRLAVLEPHRMGPFGEFVAAFHLGDPAAPEDSWHPMKRRERLYRQARAALADGR
jgi:phosphatidylserine/phosphatidylglycerophosphate/cardiolipin synthase-like enzyme